MVSPKFPEDKRGRKGWDEEELREMGALGTSLYLPSCTYLVDP